MIVFDDWSVQQMRLSLFSNAPFQVAEAVWTKLTDQDEAETRSSVPGGRQYSGQSFGGTLALTIAGPRMDIVVAFDQNRMPDVIQEGKVPALGAWSEFSPRFIELVDKFIENLDHPIIRIALGAALLGQRDSQRATYEALAQLLKSVKVEVGTMREMIFRVNWPLQSRVVSGLELNRITVWSSMVFNYGVFGSVGSNPLAMLPQPTGNGIHAISLELDHNTTADRTEPFAINEAHGALEELFELAVENAKYGERP